MKKQNKKGKHGRIFNAAVLLFIAAGAFWVAAGFLHFTRSECTDNAQIRRHITPLQTRVQGFVKEVGFEEFQPVKRGDTLVVIEDSEYRLRVAQAEADLRNALVNRLAAETAAATARNNVEVTDASIQEARVMLDNARTELERYENLLEQNAATRQQYDAVKTNHDAALARYTTAQRQRRSAASASDEQALRLEQQEALVALAESSLELARLDLSYTVITAPADGITGRKNIRCGQLLQQGQAVGVLVEDGEQWITANYRETQASRIGEGMPVEIKVDAVPGVKFFGTVRSISDATGSAYSLIPTDNSAGNFVKVEQRIPVRIDFTSENRPEDMDRLRSGMNVRCKVKL